MSFFDGLAARLAEGDSLVAVGLDADRDRLPAFLDDHDMPRWAFNRRIIDATHEHAACYKPNAAFYEDADGWRSLRETIAYAHGKGVPVLLDAKRGDIGNTARKYAEVLDEVDAITVNPYMGQDSLQPFLGREEKGVFVLCRTSNPGGADLQGLELASGEPLYQRVAALAELWNEHDNVGLVVGATAAEELEAVRESVPDLPFLVPGVGAQGGDAEAAVEHGLTAWGDEDESGDGRDVGIVNSSRGIIFAGEDVGRNTVSGASGGRETPEDAYFEAAGESAKTLKKRLNRFR